MTVTQDLDIWTLIIHASFLVKVVMFLLLAVSFMSWMFIFQKWFSIRRANRQTGSSSAILGAGLNALYRGTVNIATRSATWSASSRRAFAGSPAARPGAPTPTRATWSTARAARYAPPPARDGLPRAAPRVPRLDRLGQPLHGACSARCGASIRSAAWPTFSGRRWRRSRPASRL